MKSMNAVTKCGIGLMVWGVFCLAFTKPLHAQFPPPPSSVGATVPATYFGPVPSDVKREYIGPYQLLKSGKIDLDARTITLPLYQGKMKDGRKVWYVLTDTTDAGNAAALGLNYSAKLTYLRARPALLETALPTVILTPKHPSYPAGHGTYVAAAVTVLRSFFPDEHSEYEYLIPEVNNARVWAGVHFRDDMLAGNVIGEKVADAVMEKVHLDGSPGERSKRVLGRPLVTPGFFGDGGPNYH